MKTLLLNPPFPLFPGESKFASPPLGLAYIAGMLEKHGHEVQIIDCAVEGYDQEERWEDGATVYGLPKKEILEKIMSCRPHVLGIACVFSTLHQIVLDLCRSIKAVFPQVKIVLGGTHATVWAKEILENSNVDYIVQGEGENSMLGLIEHLEGERAIENVNGLCWKKSGKIMMNPQVFIANIDELPLPARHLLPMERYSKIGMLQGITQRGVSATTVITSRGCPASCVFCSIHAVWGHKFRAHSAGYVLNELRSLQRDFGISHIVFEDDNITFDRKRAFEIFSGMVDGNMRLSWSAPNGVAVWCLDEVLLRVIRESGCRVLYLAFESGDQETLKNIIHKPLSLEKSLEIIEACRRLKIRTQAFFVIGFPGETKEAMKRSMRLAERLSVDRISIAIATPYPGTELYEICKREGYLTEDFDVVKLMTRVGQIRTGEFGPKDVERLASLTYIHFALRHPLKTLRRLVERLQVDPWQTASFIVKRLVSIR